ncbi:MAG TPA: TIGR01777 family protein [Chitinophagaceae bacterium]|nr:TIGR01777 family protein [Chitinophagaceae bacterium]HML57068.1 TIGR01777 family oxidoreductase [Ferruginibacter sp.]
MQFLITGGTGFVGSMLTSYLLEKGHTVHILTRRPGNNLPPGVKHFSWNPENQEIQLEAFEGVQYIIHLAGAGVADKRWNKKYKLEILNSRVQSGELLRKTLNRHPHTVQGIISASAIGYYGPDKEGHTFSETDPPGDNFLSDTCKAWEESVQGINGVTLCILRLGIIFGKGGGAFPKFIAPLKYGLSAILGSGKQVISWIHVTDVCRVIEFAAQHQLSGVYNAVAPMPATNRYLTIEISHRIRKNAYIPIHVPAALLKLVLGESSLEVLKSTTVSSEKIANAGFTFLYPSIKAALNDLLPEKDN